MKTCILLTAALVALIPSAAHAQQPPGINLAWNDCTASVAGGLNATSFCTSNTAAAKNLYGTYVLPAAGAQAVAGNDIVMDIATAGVALPCWWNFTLAPRDAGYAMQFTTPCADANGIGIFNYWGSVPGGPSGSVLVTVLTGRPLLHLTATATVAPSQAGPVPGGVEIYSFTFQLKFDATVGSCTGCLTSACFVLRMIRVNQVGLPPIELTTASSRPCVFWQGGAIDAPGCPCFTDPVLNKTWGAVKALYR